MNVPSHELLQILMLTYAHPCLWRGAEPTEERTSLLVFQSIGVAPSCSAIARFGNVPWKICLNVSSTEHDTVRLKIESKMDLDERWFRIAECNLSRTNAMAGLPIDEIDERLNLLDRIVCERIIHGDTTETEDC